MRRTDQRVHSVKRDFDDFRVLALTRRLEKLKVNVCVVVIDVFIGYTAPLCNKS